MFLNRSSCEIPIGTKLHFLVQYQFTHIPNLVFVLLSDVIVESCLSSFSVEKDVYETVLADLAAPYLPHCQFVSLPLEQSGLFSQRVLAQRDDLLIA